MHFATKKWWVEFTQDYTQFFRDCGWYDFTFFSFAVDWDRSCGEVGATIAVLGLSARVDYSYGDKAQSVFDAIGEQSPADHYRAKLDKLRPYVHPDVLRDLEIEKPVPRTFEEADRAARVNRDFCAPLVTSADQAARRSRAELGREFDWTDPSTIPIPAEFEVRGRPLHYYSVAPGETHCLVQKDDGYVTAGRLVRKDLDSAIVAVTP